jgi:phenolic acid decarboxylase
MEDRVMTQDSSQHLLDGKIIDYTYDGGWRFRVRFYDGMAAYDFLGEEGEDVSNSNEDIPYQSRLIGKGRYHVAWHESNIGDFVSLIIDENEKTIYSAALLGYGASDSVFHFEHGVINGIAST